MVADLNSPDPYVRQQANGQIRMGVALGTLMLFMTNKEFEDGDEVNSESLFKVNLIRKSDANVKILGNGELKKNLNLKKRLQTLQEV